MAIDFVCVCVRIPKCGSKSLSVLLQNAFASSRIFYLPHTINLEPDSSWFQSLRFMRTQSRNLMMHYGTPSLRRTFEIISEAARGGDLIDGGHIDFPSVRRNIRRQSKMITLFREPGARVHSEYRYFRNAHLGSNALRRLDSGLRPKIAGKYSFDGYLDFLFEYREDYGNIAARYVGWDGEESLPRFFEQNVFHSGILEKQDAFVRELSACMGLKISFPEVNKTPGSVRSQLTIDQHRKIEQIFCRDLELYEWQQRNERPPPDSLHRSTIAAASLS